MGSLTLNYDAIGHLAKRGGGGKGGGWERGRDVADDAGMHLQLFTNYNAYNGIGILAFSSVCFMIRSFASWNDLTIL